jgi:hypothetical protein
MKIEPAGDYAELIPDPHDEGVNPITLCPNCNAYKPNASFKETLTRLQARQQGYAGTHAVEIERSMCVECRKPRKAFNTQSLKSIANAVYYGVITPYEADVLRAKRTKDRSMTSTDNMKKYHHAKRKEAWKPIRKVLNTDYRWASSLMGLLKKTGRERTALFFFVQRYRDVLHKHMSYKVWAYLCTSPNFTIPAPPNKLSELLADLPEPVGDIKKEWFALPYEQIHRLKPPALVREALSGTYVSPKA